jgi:hypothetical protein
MIEKAKVISSSRGMGLQIYGLIIPRTDRRRLISSGTPHPPCLACAEVTMAFGLVPHGVPILYLSTHVSSGADKIPESSVVGSLFPEEQSGFPGGAMSPRARLRD